MPYRETIRATSDGFRDEVHVTYGLETEVELSVKLNEESGRHIVWLTPKETADLITVLQYALSLMEDTDELR